MGNKLLPILLLYWYWYGLHFWKEVLILVLAIPLKQIFIQYFYQYFFQCILRGDAVFANSR